MDDHFVGNQKSSNSWVCYGLTSMLFFSAANIFAGTISDIGFKSILYFNSGSLLAAIFYFTIKLVRHKHFEVTQKLNPKTLLIISMLGGIFQLAIYETIVFTFMYAR
jgi:hypothetical protein